MQYNVFILAQPEHLEFAVFVSNYSTRNVSQEKKPKTTSRWFYKSRTAALICNGKIW